MNQELKIQTKINDLGEHLRQIRGEVATENETLNALRRERIDLKNDLEERLIEVKKQEEEIEETCDTLIRRHIALTDERKELQEQKKAFGNKVASFDSFTETKLKEIQDREKEADGHIVGIMDRLNTISAQTIQAQDFYNALVSRKKSEMEDISSSIEKLNLEHSRALQRLSTTESEVDAAQKIISDLGHQIERTDEEARKSGQKIKQAHDALEQREFEFQIKMRDYLILKKRLTKVFEELYPEQNIDHIL